MLSSIFLFVCLSHHNFYITSTIKFDTTRADGQFRKPASNKKLLSLIGGFQFTSFTEGQFDFSHALVFAFF